MPLDHNIFYALAQKLARRGEDEEDLAVELAVALKTVIVGNFGESYDVVDEFKRLLKRAGS